MTGYRRGVGQETDARIPALKFRKWLFCHRHSTITHCCGASETSGTIGVCAQESEFMPGSSG